MTTTGRIKEQARKAFEEEVIHTRSYSAERDDNGLYVQEGLQKAWRNFCQGYMAGVDSEQARAQSTTTGVARKKSAEIGQQVGVLVQNDAGALAAVHDLGRVTWLDGGVAGQAARAQGGQEVEPVAFGSGDKVVEVGTYDGKPAVFVAPAEPAGTPGELAWPTTGEDRHRLVPGEWLMTFPTEEQAHEVAGALCGRPLKKLYEAHPQAEGEVCPLCEGYGGTYGLTTCNYCKGSGKRPQPPVEQAERKRFELWYNNHYDMELITGPDDVEASYEIWRAACAWQAARAQGGREPVAYFRFRSHRIAADDVIEGLEECGKNDQGDDGSPAFPVYDHPAKHEDAGVPDATPDVIEYVQRYGGGCRDCADRDGVCESGLPCSIKDSSNAISHVINALQYGLAHGYLSVQHPAQGREWVRCSERLPTEADEDPWGQVPVIAEPFGELNRPQLLNRENVEPLTLNFPNAIWTQTGLKRPTPPTDAD